MAKKNESKACAIKEWHPIASKRDSVQKFVDVVFTRFGILVANILALLGNNQSIERKPRFIFEAPKEAEKKTKGQVATLLR